MATGDTTDFTARIRGLIPFSWFPRPSATLDAVVAGAASALAFIYSGVVYTRAQSRRVTATGPWLDLIGWDFFGARFRRHRYETDDTWRGRILPEILRPRNTRPAIIQQVANLTGRVPIMYEFTTPYDMGVLNGPYLGFDVAGKWGSIDAHTQALFTAYRPATTGIPEVPGFDAITTAAGHVLGGLDITGKLATLDDIAGDVTDADIYATVAETQAAGATIWTQILS